MSGAVSAACFELFSRQCDALHPRLRFAYCKVDSRRYKEISFNENFVDSSRSVLGADAFGVL